MRSLFWLPFVLVWTLVLIVALPALLVAVSWWLLPDGVAVLVTAGAVLYLVRVAFPAAGAAMRLRVRSATRRRHRTRSHSMRGHSTRGHRGRGRWGR